MHQVSGVYTWGKLKKMDDSEQMVTFRVSPDTARQIINDQRDVLSKHERVIRRDPKVSENGG